MHITSVTSIWRFLKQQRQLQQLEQMPQAAYCCLRYIETLPSEAPLYRSFAGSLQSPSSEATPISVGKDQMCVCMWQTLSIGAFHR